jgi:hypothetical protein
MARWSYEPSQWAELLTSHGYTDVDARVLPAPDPADVGTLVVVAAAP